MSQTMTSLQRILTALGQKPPDRVPFVLPVTMHAARQMGLSLREYFSKAEYVAEGQLRARDQFRHDAVVGFLYAPVEVEAWGGEVIFFDDGPPNSGEPFIRKPEDISHLQSPQIENCPSMMRTIEVLRLLKERIGDDALILGVVMSPFSLPVMQMGFDHYLQVMYECPHLFERLMQVNEAFCVDWANRQVAAGAMAIVYFDPVSSTTIIPREKYLQSGFLIAQRVIAQIKAPVVTHFASGRCLPILADVAQTGTVLVGVSVEEDLRALKSAAAGKVSLLGNLNAIEMRRWTPQQAEVAVKDCIARAAEGGGYILADNHGEIPYQVPEEVLMAISEAVHRWGNYPLDWVKGDAAPH
ncbi:MAG: methylcobamide--CoM methyltransferase MtbA [Anaerolineae bacterium]|nr:methylcobamide--CoM methyltransferase MtbA [Anaerolineae bacterium]